MIKNAKIQWYHISYDIHIFFQKWKRYHNTFQYHYLKFIIHGYKKDFKKRNYKKKIRNNYHFQVLINSFLNRLFLLSFLNFPRFNDRLTIFGRGIRYFEFINLQTITWFWTVFLKELFSSSYIVFHSGNIVGRYLFDIIAIRHLERIYLLHRYISLTIHFFYAMIISKFLSQKM